MKYNKYPVITLFVIALLATLLWSSSSSDNIENVIEKSIRTINSSSVSAKIKESSTSDLVAGNLFDSYYKCDRADTESVDSYINNLLLTKFKKGYNKELLIWFIDQAHIKYPPEELRKNYHNREVENSPSYEYLMHLDYIKLNDAYHNHDYDYVREIWDEFSILATSKFQLSMFSKVVLTVYGPDGPDEELIYQYYEFLNSIGAPIEPYSVFNFKNKDIEFYEQLIKTYNIDFQLQITNLVSIDYYLSSAFRKKSTGLFAYLMKYHGKPKHLAESYNSLIYTKTNIIPHLELLWSFGGRPDLKFKPFVSKLELAHPHEQIVDKINHWYSTEELSFPFDNEIRWQYEDLMNEIIPEINKRSTIIKESKEQCFHNRYGFLNISHEQIKSTALMHFQNGLTITEIEQVFFQQSRKHVQVFRNIFISHYTANCVSDSYLPQFDIADRILSGELNLYDCIGFDSNYLVNILRHTEQYIPGYTIEEFLTLLSPPDWNNFVIRRKHMGLLMDHMDTFISLGWQTDFVDIKNKTFVYNAIAWKKYDVAKLLIENNAPLDADTYGFDGLDYFLMNSGNYEKKEAWINLFISASWPIRESHGKIFDSVQEKFSTKELALLKELIIER